MDDSSMYRDMIFTAVVIALTIGALLWLVLRTLSRGGLDAAGAIRLVCSLFALGVMGYVGYTIFTLWT